MMVDRRENDFPLFTRLKKQEFRFRDYIESYIVSERISHGSLAKLMISLISSEQKALKGSGLCFGTSYARKPVVIEADLGYIYRSFKSDRDNDDYKT